MSKQAPLYNVAELAEMFGLHRTTVSKYLEEAGAVPSAKQGKAPLYALSSAVDWKRKEQAFDSGNGDVPKSARDMDSYYAAQLKKDKLMLRRGQLYHGDEVRAGVAALCRALSDGWTGLYDRVDIELGRDAEVMQLVQDAVDAGQAELHKWASDAFTGPSEFADTDF